MRMYVLTTVPCFETVNAADNRHQINIFLPNTSKSPAAPSTIMQAYDSYK